jgi:dCMP deaminase
VSKNILKEYDLAQTRPWDVRFLQQAEIISKWSKDPSTKVGAIVVNEKRVILGTGYNGFPRKVDDCEARYNDRDLKYKLVVHAEVNACLQALAAGIHGHTTLYVYPTIMNPPCCPECTKIIIQSGINRIVAWKNGPMSSHWKEMSKYSEMMLTEANVVVDLIERG